MGQKAKVISNIQWCKFRKPSNILIINNCYEDDKTMTRKCHILFSGGVLP